MFFVNYKHGSQRNKKRKKINMITRRGPGTMQYIFYSILNTDLHMNRGTAAANVSLIVFDYLIISMK